MINRRLIALLFITTIATTFTTPAFGQIVNVDIGESSSPYIGLGALPDAPANTLWNDIGGSGTNLLASDGTALTGTNMEGLSVTVSGESSFSQGSITNDLLKDYQFIDTFNNAPYEGNITILGLTADTDYLIYVYSAGDNEGQGGIIELNGVYGVTAGTQSNTLNNSNDFIEGENFAVMEVTSDTNGEISGIFRPLKSANSGVINGLQIMLSNLPTRILNVKGAESPTVNSPSDKIEVSITFSEQVTLSQAGGSQIQLDFAGTLVNATHAGSTSGTELHFEATAPSTTASGALVVANSLQLIGATLLDSNGVAVPLNHDAFTLANDQVSDQGLAVYSNQIPDPVTGQNLPPSPYYSFRVRETSEATWQAPFAWITQSKIDNDPNAQAVDGSYKDQISGWSHTYANFEMANNVEVEIEITQLDGNNTPVDIQKAVPHPRHKIKSWRVENGKVYVIIDKPTLFAVDINGQFDDQLPQLGQSDAFALHAVTVFANPFILDKPDLNDPVAAADILTITPGTIPPDNAPESIYYFLPGVHQLFSGSWGDGNNGNPNNGALDDFRLRSDKSYYIPGDAIVHASMNNEDDNSDNKNIRVYGHGTISGERIPHHNELGIFNPDDTYHLNKPLRIDKAKGARVEGITIADSANHSLALKGGFDATPKDYSYIRWTKVITWRANGDGISPNGTAYLEDSFIRTQDDGTYISGLGIRRNVYWSDVNGMPLRLSNMLNDNPAIYDVVGDLLVEDNDILYARGIFGIGETGHSTIGLPSPAVPFTGNDGSHIVFRDIFVHDRFPTRRLFGWDLFTLELDDQGQPIGTPLADRRPIANINLKNIRAAAALDPNLPLPDPGKPTEDFLGLTQATITGLIFDDVVLEGQHYTAIEDFTKNANVSGFTFNGTAAQTMAYQNLSGYRKWYVANDWDSEVEPANNDIVNHTATAVDLIVDAYAYAGTLNISNAGTAVVSVRNGGHLTIADQVSLGVASAPGELRIIDGELILDNNLSSALAINNGSKLYLERGTLLWSGEHITDIETLFLAGAIEFANGGPGPADNGATLIGQSGTNLLFASEEGGFTRISVVQTESVEVGMDWPALAILGIIMTLLANTRLICRTSSLHQSVS